MPAVHLVMINGYGFPAHKGGPMFASDAQASGTTASASISTS